MEIRKAISFLANYGQKMSDTALRAAVRRNKISEVQKNEENGTYTFSRKGLTEYLLKNGKLGLFDAYRLGYDNSSKDLAENVIDYPGRVMDRSTYLFAKLLPNEYSYIHPNFWDGYNTFEIKYDSENKIIHLFDDSQTRGTSAINLASDFIIKDILLKINDRVLENEILNTTLIIYTAFVEDALYSAISSYGYSELQNDFVFHVKDKEFIDSNIDEYFKEKWEVITNQRA